MASPRLLIVDDEPQLIRVMRQFLEFYGYEVDACHDATTAWQRIQSNPGTYTLAVVDMTMPGMSGHELAGKILQEFPELKVIAASGYPVDPRPLEALAPGRVAFLHKPFGPEMLAGTVQRLIGSK